MSSVSAMPTTPIHEKNFEEFAASTLVACVRAGPAGVLSVVDVDAPGWAGLDKVRVEVARMYSAAGHSRTVASSLTNRLLRACLDESFVDDARTVPLDGPSTLIFVKEHQAKRISPREVLRRVHAHSILQAMGQGRTSNSKHEELAPC